MTSFTLLQMEKDIHLIRDFQSGDESAFSKIYRKFNSSILNRIRTIIRNTEAAEEVMQEVFLKLYRFRDKYDGSRPLSTWIHTLARNTAMDWLRKNMNTLTGSGGEGEALPEEIPCKEPAVEIVLIQRERYSLFLKLYESLSALQKKILMMRVFDRLSHSEIADRLGLSPSAVKSALYRARLALEPAY